ncbi:MAG: MBOAT family protein [Proteobacteria bacterium]|nr:MBOAT family protein [Pseudomonadota bacterium]
MLFNSYQFILVFLPITFLVFYALGKVQKYQLAMLWLVVASLFFYSWWAYKFLFLLLFSITANYFIGTRIIAKLSEHPKVSKSWLIGGIVFNLSLLIFYKYTNFLIDSVNVAFAKQFTHLDIVLPLAISFFTFQQIAFLVDLYQGKAKIPPLLTYFLFNTFFPQLIAGPIVHHQEMIPQLDNKRVLIFRPKNISIGLTIFIIGLFKKVGIADNLAPIADQVFKLAAMGEIPTFWEGWTGALCYSFQLYFDFSGYSDMAIGLAKLFGINLPINFNSPYKAANIIDFWRRWHITLSRFLRDYLYIPLGGNKHGTFNRYKNLMLTMLLGGLWHGAGLNFILWGALHGAYLIVNHLWQQIYKNSKLNFSHLLSYRYACHVLTFLSVVFAWVLFRAENFESAMRMYQAMSGSAGIQLPARLTVYLEQFSLSSLFIANGMFHHLLFQWQEALLMLTAAVIVCFSFPNTIAFMNNYYPIKQEYFGNQRTLSVAFKPTVLWALFLSLLAFICLTLLSHPSEFLYYKF